MADVGHVDPDLMRTPGLQGDRQQGMQPKALQNPIVGHRGPAARHDPHTGPIPWVTTNGLVDVPPRHQQPAHEGAVLPVHTAPLQLLHQRLVGGQGLGHHEQTAGVLVEAMHDAGARQLVEVRRVMQQRVLQSTVPIARGGMNHESGRLVDHQNLLVFVYQVQGYRLWRAFAPCLQDDIDPHLLAAPDLVSASAKFTIDLYAALFDPLLQAAARKLRQQIGEGLIEPSPSQIHADMDDPPARIRPFDINHCDSSASVPATAEALLYTSSVFVWVNRRMTYRILSLFLFVLALSLSACTWLDSKKDRTKDWSVTKLYSEAAQELDDGNYSTAIEYYEKLEARFPFGRYAMQSQLDVAYAHFKAEEPEAALAAADRFIKLYPQNPFVDYAYYLKGIINYNRSVGFLDRYIPTDPSQRDPGSALDAFEDFAALVRRFPESKYATDARQRMLYLRNNLGKHEVNVARYYVKRGAYLAAVERCNYVIEHFQRTSAVEGALEIMISSYKQLGEDKLAADAQRVLTLNQNAGRLLKDGPAPSEIGLSRKIWVYLELDEN